MSTFGVVARCGLVVILTVWAPSAVARDWVFRLIDDQFDGSYSEYTASLNDAGIVVFNKETADDEPVIYLYDGVATRVLVDTSGQFRELWNPVVNENGLVAFRSRLDDYSYDAIYATVDGVTFETIVHPDDPIRIADGLSINSDGAVGFWGGWTTSTRGGSTLRTV